MLSKRDFLVMASAWDTTVDGDPATILVQNTVD